MASYGSSSFYSEGQDFRKTDLKFLRKLSPSVQSHLKKVYLTLTCALAAAAVGVYLHFLWNIGGLLTGFGCVGAVLWLLFTPPTPYNERKRVNLLMAAAVCKGATLGPLIEGVIQIDSSILVGSLGGTALAFACFTGAAVLARRREFIFMGGVLGSCVSVLVWLQFAGSIFGGSMALYTIEIYFGLMVFLGYIIYDTQMIIERADLGDSDYVKHALDLFTDFVAVFVRLLIIMTKNAEDRSEKEKKKKRA